MNKEATPPSPILNNPYEEPLYHYDNRSNGDLSRERVLPGRRAFDAQVALNFIPTGDNRQQELYSGDELREMCAPYKDKRVDVNLLRTTVGQWRDAGYPGVTHVTLRLLNYWFCDPDRAMPQRLFFCQREAVETAVWLNEIAPTNPNVGMATLRELAEGNRAHSNPDAPALPRQAFKMATGTGKTVVMAMLIVYNYLNKKASPADARFVEYFLLVAPNLTIRDRLGVLRIDLRSVNNGTKTDYYHRRGLVAPQWEHDLEGLNGRVVIVNSQQFLPKQQLAGKHKGCLDDALGYKEEPGTMLRRVLGRGIKSGSRLLVINDEAHHCYYPQQVSSQRPKRGGKKRGSATTVTAALSATAVPATPEHLAEDADEESTLAQSEQARVWHSGLLSLLTCGYKVNHVYDLSATPYYLHGSGRQPYSLFPWVVSDFGLLDALESGLVKIPFLPCDDDTLTPLKSLDQKAQNALVRPVFLHLYENVRDGLPKTGQRTARKKINQGEGSKAAKGDKMNEALWSLPRLPDLLNNALDQFAQKYADYERERQRLGEQRPDLLNAAPPVMIVACNNTTVSLEVYKYLAGQQIGEDDEGRPIYTKSDYPLFSNYDSAGVPLRHQQSLLIDSAQLESADGKIDELFRRVYEREIASYRDEVTRTKGEAAGSALSAADIMREMANTVGMPGRLGASIRLVVSVSMLSEGWDANTVTHVCGLRAFGSQLLCEQIVGRALRRRSYTLQPYDRATRQPLDDDALASRSSKGKEKDVLWLFPPEYAQVIGVPFSLYFKGGGATATVASKPQSVVRALEEREALEITFPNVVGYRTEEWRRPIEADFEGDPKFVVDKDDLPGWTKMQASIGRDTDELLDRCRATRDHFIVMNIAAQVYHEKYGGRDADPLPNGQRDNPMVYGDLLKVSRRWYDERVEVRGGDGSPEWRRAVQYAAADKVVESVYSGIRRANAKDRDGRNNIRVDLDHYTPTGSTRYVRGLTTKPVQATTKSHVNVVVCDTLLWEQSAARALERLPEVIGYVKNEFLHFHIPYLDRDNIPHKYVPDFLARVRTPKGDEVTLIIEVSGMSNDELGSKDYKRKYAADYWVPGVNALGEYGRWSFVEVSDIANIEKIVRGHINQL